MIDGTAKNLKRLSHPFSGSLTHIRPGDPELVPVSPTVYYSKLHLVKRWNSNTK